MDFQKPLCLFLLLLTLLSCSQALKFNVGGSQGWVPNPSESYNNWAGRNRFQINDTLVFKYKKNSDSVLVVKKEDYDKCNKTNPIKKFENGDTEFKLDRSGPFYFISGKDGNCENGQKLIVVVLTPRTPKTSPPASPPSLNPPTMSPPSPSPSSSPPISPSHPPNTSPSPASSPAPASLTPPSEGPYPPPTLAPSPFTSPPAPGPETATPASSPGPSSPPAPPGGPTSPPPGEPTSPSPSSNATAPAKNNGFSVAPSNLVVFFVTIVVGATLLRGY